MNDFVRDLQKVERSLSEEKGTFNLFALFLREDAAGKWDLLVAAPWVEQHKAQALKRVTEELRKTLSKNELLKLSRLVLIDRDNPSLAAIHKAVHAEHSDTEIRDGNFFGLQIKHAHIITSRRTEAA